MQQGWSAPSGYASLNLARVWNYMHDSLGIVAPVGHNTFPSLDLERLGPFPYPSMGLVVGADPRSKTPVLNPTPDARVYLAPSVRLVRDAGEATALMRQGHDFHGTALVEQPMAMPEQVTPFEGRAAITHFAPERIAIAVESMKPALLVVAEPWYPGWSASVDGSTAPCVPANAWMRAVPVPAGKSEVVLVFRSTYLLTGATISLLALALIALLLVRRRSVSGSRTAS
jgi:Bacterial membrane protein YfhO